MDDPNAFIRPVKNSDVAKQRIVVSAGPYKFQEWVSIAHGISNKLPTENPSLFYLANPNNTHRFDLSKATKHFGIQYISEEQTAKDMLDQFEQHGLL